ncbi:hypothetical protein COV49_01960 [Candidatus Falkowbacteria bacterium CG11_big_fil_rev_8_21_14_0_20_39_10]|uniref:Uncharacterized protein n=1 Tax=Candidatus Falkowbacteria bacterium CG11_big_fil_rev_8_21_14_0_20_39_10 TaxID=1974570 RepID=A0A2M6K9L1_9BACT|nr:MAG: hypothetical protein COV49_01960 [Candidatus Falkowbacteria bacterium CG11_big_fil_rev_8_21_14_0_20_39_10]
MESEKIRMRLDFLGIGYEITLTKKSSVVWEIISKSSCQVVVKNPKTNCVKTFGLKKWVYFWVIFPSD